MRYGTADVYRSVDGSSARITGLTTCGLPWSCPVCGAKVAEVRRRELSESLAAWVNAEQGGAYLLTLTFPHARADELGTLVDLFLKARQRWKNSRTYKRHLGPDSGAAGAVTALEVTWGANGWHPHVHMLVFHQRGALGEGEPAENGDLSSRAIDELKNAWVKALIKDGLCDQSQASDTWHHGLNVRGGEKAAEYIAKYGHDEKWGASSELTRAARKVGAAGEVAGEIHVTPFQLLAWAGQGDGLSAELFRTYVAAFKGKRLLTWSPGLRKRLNLSAEEAPDDQVAAQDDPLPEEKNIASIDAEGLAVLVSRGLFGEFHLYVAESCSDPGTAQADVDDYIAWAKAQPKIGRGSIMTKKMFGSSQSGYMQIEEHTA